MKKTFSAILALVLALSLCGCGSIKSTVASETYNYVYPEYEYASADMEYSTADYSAVAMSVAGNSAYGKSGASYNGEEENGTAVPGAQVVINPEKIIYSGSASIETTDFDGSIAKLEEMIKAAGGFIESSSFNDSSYWSKSRGYSGGRSASYELRVPSEKFSGMMNGLPALGNVPSSSSSSTNVTSQYYDVSARLEAYRAQEARLIELYAIAETMDDIISVEDRLAEVRYSIESLQSTLNNYDRQVAYSDIYLYISEVAEYTPTVPVNRSFGEQLADAVKDGLSNALDFVQGLILVLAESLPTLIIAGVIIAVVIIVIRKLTAKRRAERKARREAKRAAKAEKE